MIGNSEHGSTNSLESTKPNETFPWPWKGDKHGIDGFVRFCFQFLLNFKICTAAVVIGRGLSPMIEVEYYSDDFLMDTLLMAY